LRKRRIFPIARHAATAARIVPKSLRASSARAGFAKRRQRLPRARSSKRGNPQGTAGSWKLQGTHSSAASSKLLKIPQDAKIFPAVSLVLPRQRAPMFPAYPKVRLAVEETVNKSTVYNSSFVVNPS
jgi:hypothetical protein